MKRPAFTLIELLVVVAILAILISILMPALGRARAQAKQTVCAVHLHSIGTAVYNYWTEWNGRVPYVWSPMTNGDFGDPEKADDELNPFDRERWPCSLPNVLMPTYMAEQPAVFTCPEALNAWPRRGGSPEYTYRPASANQPNGIAQPAESYSRESFGFMDGRMLRRFRMELHADPTSSVEIIENVMEYGKSRGAYLRDLLQMRKSDADPVLGPHRGGILLLNRDLQVEFRDQKTMQADLAPNFSGARF